MIQSIPTNTSCWCGCAISVQAPHAGQWSAHCPDCYDGTDDAGELAHVVGWGETPDDALWAWADALEEVSTIALTPAATAALEAFRAEERLPASSDDVVADLARDVSVEAARQRGWISAMELVSGVHEVECYWFGPEAQRAC